MTDTPPVVRLRDAGLRRGDRWLWEHLDLEVAAGEFIAILGANGSGKTSLLRVILGLDRLTAGSIEVLGRTPRRGSDTVGYVPQQKAFDRDVPVRGLDLVRLGVDGHRLGLRRSPSDARGAVAEAVAAVGAEAFAGRPIGRMSGGEQQRLRIAQSIAGDPRLLLCDEPLLSLDLRHQAEVTRLIDGRRRAGCAVLFVSHELNQILGVVDRVLYLAAGRWALGPPDEVMTGPSLSRLYGTKVEVVRVRDRFLVVGAEAGELGDEHPHHPGGAG